MNHKISTEEIIGTLLGGLLVSLSWYVIVTITQGGFNNVH